MSQWGRHIGQLKMAAIQKQIGPITHQRDFFYLTASKSDAF